MFLGAINWKNKRREIGLNQKGVMGGAQENFGPGKWGYKKTKQSQQIYRTNKDKSIYFIKAGKMLSSKIRGGHISRAFRGPIIVIGAK